MFSYAWRGPKGSGKRTALLEFLKEISIKKGAVNNIEGEFTVSTGIWIMGKNGLSVTREGSGGGGEEQQGAGGDEDDELEGKKIPYEYSHIHIGFDVARMSMSDKIFLGSILTRWTGQDDLTLTNSTLPTRYLVLYHAHLLADESILQIQETLEKYDNFGVLMTTELPICNRLSDHVFEIPVAGPDRLFEEYKAKWEPDAKEDCWLTLFRAAFDKWTSMNSYSVIYEIREWIYICLQRNLRWTDIIYYWMEVVNEITWLLPDEKKELWLYLAMIESGGGWNLIPSYRIPIFWEQNYAEFATKARNFRLNKKSVEPTSATSQ